jgi:hypothetical protein
VVLQFKLGCQIQGMIIGRCGEMAFFEEGLDRRSNGRAEFVKHLHPPWQWKAWAKLEEVP